MNGLNPDTRSIFAEASNIYSTTREIEDLYNRMSYVFDGGIDLQGAGLPLLLIPDKFQKHISTNYSGKFISNINVFNVLQLIRNVSSAKTLAAVFKEKQIIDKLQMSWNEHVNPHDVDVMTAVNANNNRAPGFLGYTFGYSFLSAVYGIENIGTQLCPLTNVTVYPAIDMLMEEKGFYEPVASFDDLKMRIIDIYGSLDHQGDLFVPLAKRQMGSCPFGRGTNAIFRCLGEDAKRGNIPRWNILNGTNGCGNRSCNSQCVLINRNLNNAAAIDTYMQYSQHRFWDEYEYIFEPEDKIYKQRFEKKKHKIIFTCTQMDKSTGEIVHESNQLFEFAQPRKPKVIPAAGVYARDRVIKRIALTFRKNLQPTEQQIALHEQTSLSTVSRAVKCMRCLQLAGGIIFQKGTNPLDECNQCVLNYPDAPSNPMQGERCPIKIHWEGIDLISQI